VDSFHQHSAGITKLYPTNVVQQPISLRLKYYNVKHKRSLNANEEFVIKSDINKTIPVLNSNQLLIDTNYDGIYESGTEYSSFEIRFRFNSTTPISSGNRLSNFDLFIKSISLPKKTYPMTHQ
jgi:hypothetical protein